MKLGLLGVAAVSVMLAGAVAPARAQDGPGGGGMRGQFAGMQRVSGEVLTVADGKLTVKGEDGVVNTIVTTDNTRVVKSSGQMPGAGGGMRGGGEGGARGGGNGANMTPIKIADVKPGDGAMAMGQLDAPNKTLHAVFVVTTDASVVKAMKENLGKTYIAGKVAAIDLDNAKMTVTRPDGVAQVIQLDENTSFRRGGRGPRGAGAEAGAAPGAESITLADIKVGDQVAGQGAVKSGAFVPRQLVVSTPRPRPADAK